MSEASTSQKILVTGSSGQLGKSIAKIADQYPDYQFVMMGREALDITDREACDRVIREVAPSVVINCAAYTAVDRAEEESQKASAINERAVKILAKLCEEVGAILVHYSSDYVYHHQEIGPIPEGSPTKPKGVYAETKRAGEQAVLARDIPAIIIRTSWVYSEYGHNFLKTMLRLGESRDTLSIVADQIGGPTYAPDLALATMQMIAQVHEGVVHLDGPLIVNYAGEGQVSWFDFAQYIFACAGLQIEVSAISTAEYPTAAARPAWSVLDMTKIKSIFGIAPRYWKASVKTCLTELELKKAKRK